MAAVRDYFDTDFNYAVRVYTRLPLPEFNTETVLLYDFHGYKSLLACYDPDPTHTVQYYLNLLAAFKPGATPVDLAGKIIIPSARDFPGMIRVENVPGIFAIHAQFFGDPNWVSSKDLRTSVPVRIFLYSESDLSEADVVTLKTRGLEIGYEVQYRSKRHALERSRSETPLALSYDSRDNEIARAIAIALNRMICPVWYAEFSLQVGDNLCDNIENGLKECHKCILILSKHFFANTGWTKREFDSIFTRDILEKRKLVLPVWYNVSPQEVFDYSPSLLNVLALDWATLGEEAVCRKLFNVIIRREQD
jgi:hypothetical protein